MRTTLTLDEDVAIRLDALRRSRRLPWKEVVNQALRAGMDCQEGVRSTGNRPFCQKTFRLQPRLPDLDDVSTVLATAEGEDWR
jgi:hypothetical protein